MRIQTFRCVYMPALIYYIRISYALVVEKYLLKEENSTNDANNQYLKRIIMQK